ncbi:MULTISPECIES: hypothetical protein [unclassified Paenibacillus]|uniref:hypothetical protein n=1 Tax=unclassified Paenibacillus TaxID=185978 RepID=UPI001642A381|nr:hypothetical protein [Paenibacillus sp. Y412MC10]
MTAIVRRKKGIGGLLNRWPAWIGSAAMIWSLIYGGLHLYWLLGGNGYPFKHGSMGIFSALITYIPQLPAGAIFVMICIAGVFVGVVMHGEPTRILPRWLILGYAWGFAIALILLIPDISLIMSMAYAFLFKFTFTGQMLFQLYCILGAFLWTFAGLGYRRKSLRACMHCGRSEGGNHRLMNRLGRIATVIAALAPVPYAVSRFAWALNIPLGVDSSFVRDFPRMNPMAYVTEWVFGSLCIGGGLLTLGLIKKWGEVFPRWFPFVGGKRVPISLAVIPSLFVAVPVTAAGVVFSFAYLGILFNFIPLDGFPLNAVQGGIGPMILWVPWGVALGVAAVTYYYRRRGACGYCNRP